MELHTFEFVTTMPQAHDDAVFGFSGDGQLAGERLAFNDQRVITRGSEWLCQISEKIFPVMMNFAGFAVKEFCSANDLPAEGRADRLMTEANAKNWKFPREPLHQLHRNARLMRSAGARRYDDFLRLAFSYLLD